MSKLIDLSGQRFGRLTVLERSHESKCKNRQAKWKCLCDCGNITYSGGYELRSGSTISCGCYHIEECGNQHRTHGLSKTRLYRIYCKMKERCYKPNNDNYKYYGGLGITICDEWLNDFAKFAEWAMTNGYEENLTIDRIDNEKGYCPENCRWLTIQDQQKNKRKKGTVYGKQQSND